MDADDRMQDLFDRAGRAPAYETSSFRAGDRTLTPAEVVEGLSPFVTPERRARIEEVLDGRTYTVATVVEGLVNTGNVSAVMRTAEALGFQAFHVVKGGTDDRFKTSARTTQGADKWLDVWTWETPRACVDALRAGGYRIVATHLDETAVPISEVDFTQKTALVFGNERDGVSREMLALTDQRCIVPMVGFVQSFNISVAAAVSLYHAYRDRLARQGRHGDLTPERRDVLRAAYYLRSVRAAEHILANVE